MEGPVNANESVGETPHDRSIFAQSNFSFFLHFPESLDLQKFVRRKEILVASS